MNVKIHNRENPEKPGDGWYQIEVSGNHRAADGRVQAIDATAKKSIVATFNRAAASENFPGMLVDIDHLSHDMDKSTESYGWLKELREEGGEIEGRIEWTDIGATAIHNKRFKFFSTEYNPQDLEDLGGGRVRPLALSGLALTNRPNNRGGKPISNRADDGEVVQQNDKTKTMKEIAQALGLPEDADMAACVTAINSLKSASKDADETIKNRDAELTTHREREADEILAKHADKLGSDADVKAHFRAGLILNRESTEKVLNAMPSAKAPLAAVPDQGLRNRATSPAPIKNEAGVQDAAAIKTAAAIRNRANSIMASEKLPWSQAFDRAKAELA